MLFGGSPGKYSNYSVHINNVTLYVMKTFTDHDLWGVQGQ